MLLNLIVRKYGTCPDTYRLVGFDNSPIAEAAVIPMSTIGQQIDVIAKEAVSLLVELIRYKKDQPAAGNTPVIHRIVTPVLYKRDTTEHFSDGHISEQ